MRRRLVIIYGSLLVAVLLALALPLAMTTVRRDSQWVGADRLGDAAYLAAVAEPALRAGEVVALTGALRRYDDLYGTCVAVVDVDGRTVARSRGPATPPDADTCVPAHTGNSSEVRRALAGEQASGDTAIWPWEPAHVIVAVPVRSNEEVIGAVVTLSPITRMRDKTIRNWSLLGLAGVVSMSLCLLAAAQLARWTLRPVDELDAAAQAIAEGDHMARAPADVGPPELRWLTLAFNNMADTVTDALDRQRAFVAQASHQLRNPLTALLLRMEALEEEPFSADGQSEYQLAINEIDRLRRLLEGLLSLVRAEREGDRLQSVDAVAVAIGRIHAWQPLAAVKHIALRLDVPDTPVPVQSVATGLEQTIDVLLDNALKFGARTVTVRVIDGNCPQVQVIDDGRGIAPEELHRATERFWRDPAVQNTDGYGLGLSIATALTTAARGTLRLRHADGGGLRVDLSLVAARTADAASPESTPPP